MDTVRIIDVLLFQETSKWFYVIANSYCVMCELERSDQLYNKT